MKSTRNLRLRLRLMEGALLLLLALGTTAAVSTHQLLLDAANHPTSAISLSSPYWTDTLDAARLPANVPLLDAGSNVFLGDVSVGGNLYRGVNLVMDGNGALFTNGYEITDGAGTLFVNNGVSASIFQVIDGNGNLYGGFFQVADTNGNVYANALTTTGSFSSDGGQINSSGQGDLTLSGGITVGQYGYLFPNGADVYSDDPNTGNGLYVGGIGINYFVASGGLGAYGVRPPASQPATPANLAEVIALLRAYGLCQ